MIALRDLQAAFGRALQGEPEPALLEEIAGDGLPPGARLAIYRHHVRTTLTDVLATAYPVVRRLVDPRFFGYAADQFIGRCLPAGPCLFEYGESFAEFLAGFPPCRDLAYLPDVARLEWALHVAWCADDATPLDPARLAAVPAQTRPRLALRLDPSVSYLDSPWPIDAIWRGHQSEAAEATPVDVAAGGTQLEVRRRADEVVFRSLDAGTFAFRRALHAGQPMAEAADRALAVRPDFPLAQAIGDLLQEGIAVDLALVSPHQSDLPCP
jgi:hypothetical protein